MTDHVRYDKGVVVAKSINGEQLIETLQLNSPEFVLHRRTQEEILRKITYATGVLERKRKRLKNKAPAATLAQLDLKLEQFREYIRKQLGRTLDHATKP